MRPLETIQAELDAVAAQMAVTPTTDLVTLSDLQQRRRELSSEIAESRRGTPPAAILGRA